MLALMKMMPQVGVALSETDRPNIADDEILMKVHACGICGSDVHAFGWNVGYHWMTQYLPVTLGHEASGIVAETGRNVTSLKAGDKVICFPVDGCGSCDLCKAGRMSICPDKVLTGYRKNGALAEYVAIKANSCVKLEDDADLDAAALTEPLCIGRGAVSKVDNLGEKKIAIFGAGIIGLGTGYFASEGNADVWIFAQTQDMPKIDVARQMGVIDMINVNEADTAEAARKATDGKGFDVIFDCTGSPNVLKNAFSLLKSSGSVITFGIYPSEITFDINAMIRSEKKLITTYSDSIHGFKEVAHVVQKRPELFKNLISGVYPLQQGIEAFELARSGKAVKVLVKP